MYFDFLTFLFFFFWKNLCMDASIGRAENPEKKKEIILFYFLKIFTHIFEFVRCQFNIQIQEAIHNAFHMSGWKILFELLNQSVEKIVSAHKQKPTHLFVHLRLVHSLVRNLQLLQIHPLLWTAQSVDQRHQLLFPLNLPIITMIGILCSQNSL